MKKLLAMLLAVFMTFTASIGGVVAMADEGSTVDHSTTITIDVYDVAANYQGVMTGWFANIIKDKFNVEINIIAPQVAGDGAALYQTRCSSGNLGDIVILDNSDMIDCIQSGLVKDISADIWNYTNLADYQEQISTFNNMIESANGGIYAIPCGMTNTSPTTSSSTDAIAQPQLPWDLYTELGRPEIKDLDGLLDVLEDMIELYPTNADGDSVYPITMWSDWDSTHLANISELCYWYGCEVNGSITIDVDGNMKDLVAEDGYYKKIAKFFFDAKQRGLVDPDSGTQDWNTVCSKMTNKRVLLLWSSWMDGFYNNDAHNANGENYMYIPITDTFYYMTSDSYYGGSRAWGVGSQVDDEKYARIMEFLDWYASPESVLYQASLIKGFNYEEDENGKYYITLADAAVNNEIVPDEFGGGGMSDGSNKLNQWIVSSSSINPANGEAYSSSFWSSEQNKEKLRTDSEWSELYGGANTVVECMQNMNQVKIVPSVNLVLEQDDTDISLIRSECGNIVCEYSWKMIFADDEDTFNALWDEMKQNLSDYGWEDLVNFDMQKYQPVVDVRNK